VFTSSYSWDFSLHWQVVLKVSSPDCHQDRRTGPVNGRNHFRGAGDQNVRVGEAILRYGGAGA